MTEGTTLKGYLEGADRILNEAKLKLEKSDLSFDSVRNLAVSLYDLALQMFAILEELDDKENQNER